MKSQLVFIVLLACVGLVSVPTANAAVLNPFFAVGLNTFEDTSVDRVLDREGTVLLPDASGHLILQAGDYLEATARFSTLNTALISDLVSPYNFTAHVKLQILSVTPNAPGSPLATINFGNGFDATTAVKLYDDGNGTPGSLLTRYTTSSAGGEATDIASATDGTLIATLGLVGSNGDFWQAFNSLTDAGVFRNDGDPNTQGGDFYFGVSLLTNPGNLPVLTVANGGGVPTNAGGFHGAFTKHDFTGNGDLIDPITVDPPGVDGPDNLSWLARDNTLFNFVGVPEPASFLVWAGLGSVAALWVCRRRRRA